MQWCGNIDFLSKTHHRPRPRIERMIGFLIEHYAGNFPVWLSPEQARIIPITDGQRASFNSCAARASASARTWAPSALTPRSARRS